MNQHLNSTGPQQVHKKGLKSQLRLDTRAKKIEPKSKLYSVARTLQKWGKIIRPQTRYKRKYIYVKSALCRLAVDAKNRAKMNIIQAQHRKKLTKNQDTIIASLQTQKQITNIIEVKARRRREKKWG